MKFSVLEETVQDPGAGWGLTASCQGSGPVPFAPVFSVGGFMGVQLPGLPAVPQGPVAQSRCWWEEVVMLLQERPRTMRLCCGAQCADGRC